MRYHKQAMIVAPQPEPTEAGADVLVAGNAVFGAADPRQAIAGLLGAMDAGRARCAD